MRRVVKRRGAGPGGPTDARKGHDVGSDNIGHRGGGLHRLSHRRIVRLSRPTTSRPSASSWRARRTIRKISLHEAKLRILAQNIQPRPLQLDANLEGFANVLEGMPAP
jgi:hypothetical protein